MKNPEAILKSRGYRLTAQRHEIIRSLKTYPQSVEEIKQGLDSKNKPIDKVTIYRTLDRLTQLGIVSKTQFSDKSAKYEILSETHHHHLICNGCDSIQDIVINEKLLFRNISKKNNFEINSHSLEFFGLCANCR